MIFHNFFRKAALKSCIHLFSAIVCANFIVAYFRAQIDSNDSNSLSRDSDFVKKLAKYVFRLGVLESQKKTTATRWKVPLKALTMCLTS